MNPTDILDTAAVAAFLGIKPESVRQYRTQGRGFPAPDGEAGGHPWWYRRTIQEQWIDTRGRSSTRRNRVSTVLVGLTPGRRAILEWAAAESGYRTLADAMVGFALHGVAHAAGCTLLPFADPEGFTATVDLNPYCDTKDYPWRVTSDAFRDRGGAPVEIDDGSGEIASEDSAEWARLADAALTAAGWTRTGPWAEASTDTMTAPVTPARSTP